jgi:hypothetical protein
LKEVENKVFEVAVLAVASREKCTKLYALIAEKNAKYLSNLAETDLFTAEIVSERRKVFN